MLTALCAAEEKLRQYYSKAEDVHGDVFAIGTVLAPQHKLRFFRSRKWGGGPNWLLDIGKALRTTLNRVSNVDRKNRLAVMKSFLR
jgi:hypothetical protein